jgi:RNHCP domain
VSKKFTKTKEDFTCTHCGFEVKGNGYTNHCPKCLWSRHVDINPGDRESECGGMMIPFWIEKEGNKYFVYQKCQKCEHERRNHIGESDNFDAAIEIMKKEAEKLARAKNIFKEFAKNKKIN